ncbi:Phosphatidylinositol 3,4,5-trisphosphate 3-phosphatase and dual-specificity protein phosphatase [Lachnellula occidentalis]|uniref:phosphatidylinositol-3,4,5-trisphosphate 3-phosphatase n=1 Tax=Lachnellula occidentalis TaxID=215460 RepID=A0A8H8RQP8_9HELO|nr:Phosphatidylinositol 3,4,5-trisphosphate 3-phosphatase and dual-specificity protein phosphatase [Lachnellula occidentalis]
MASLLRQIVAGPRSRHPEAGLDLCYVTDNIIATSGPSGTYPQRAYRNPLDQLVKFLDYKHGKEWAIWEFRAEGTGYPDSEVYGRVWHYPWPDHHPPPFRLVPMIMAGMRNWLHEGAEEGKAREDRVVVVHCKAGKGRSGTMACSYLISECGWTPSEALARFTERRMRPGFGQGVSIPSQLRWVGYVDRWTKAGKVYVDRQIEIMELHVWGLRDGVKVQVEGYVDDGKTLKLFHVFTKKERVIVEGNAPGSGGLKDRISDMAGFQNEGKVPRSKTMEKLDGSSNGQATASSEHLSSSSSDTTGAETGGNAVIFKPSTRVILPTSDINIDFERRNKASMGWTMVTAVAHVWFNAFFEGNGPEQGGKPDDSGTYEIEWDAMDGIRGSSKKGTRAFDRLAVVWKAYDPEPGRGRKEDVIHEPRVTSPVPQVSPADWKGGNETSPGLGKDLGLRTESPASANVSKASSIDDAAKDTDNDSETGVKTSDPTGKEDLDLNVDELPQPGETGTDPTLAAVNAGLDTASSTTPNRGSETSSPAVTEAVRASTDPTGSSSASMIPTSDLPDGVPTDQLKTAKEHKLGHMSSVKKNSDS